MLLKKLGLDRMREGDAAWRDDSRSLIGQISVVAFGVIGVVGTAKAYVVVDAGYFRWAVIVFLAAIGFAFLYLWLETVLNRDRALRSSLFFTDHDDIEKIADEETRRRLTIASAYVMQFEADFWTDEERAIFEQEKSRLRVWRCTKDPEWFHRRIRYMSSFLQFLLPIIFAMFFVGLVLITSSVAFAPLPVSSPASAQLEIRSAP